MAQLGRDRVGMTGSRRATATLWAHTRQGLGAHSTRYYARGQDCHDRRWAHDRDNLSRQTWTVTKKKKKNTTRIGGVTYMAEGINMVLENYNANL